MMKPDVRGFFDPVTATWTYVVRGEDEKKCAVIDSVLDYDPASGHTSTVSADQVISFIKERNLEVEWILETHIHADHLTASQYLKQKLGGRTAISKHILNVLKTWLPIFGTEADTPADGSQFDHLFEDDEMFSIGKLDARIIHTPGHTPADTTYILGDAAFVGDAMFLPDVGTGRCDFPGASAADSYESAQKILSLPNDFRIYTAHDYPPNGARGAQCMTTVAEQKVGNIAINVKITRDVFIKNRTTADKGKSVPPLLLPSLQVNLRAGIIGDYIKIPVNKI
jgi:glyoxylase-like metal-dependent hydrolase (beta-lactamase superfamily II)